MKHQITKIGLASVGLTVLLMSGCARTSSPQHMFYEYKSAKPPVTKSFKDGIQVGDVSGGHTTIPFFGSKISSDGFKQALDDSLKASGLSSKLASANYRLDAKILKLRQPLLGGFKLSVELVVMYTLFNQKNNKVIFNKQVDTLYMAGFKESLIAADRLKKANEGAARKNIRGIIEYLYHYKLKTENTKKMNHALKQNHKS